VNDTTGKIHLTVNLDYLPQH